METQPEFSVERVNRKKKNILVWTKGPSCVRGRRVYLKAASGWGECGGGSEHSLRPVCARRGDDWARHPGSSSASSSSQQRWKMRTRSVFTCLDIPEALQRSASQRATRKAPLAFLTVAPRLCAWVCVGVRAHVPAEVIARPCRCERPECHWYAVNSLFVTQFGFTLSLLLWGFPHVAL